jgi:hypothetical protein
LYYCTTVEMLLHQALVYTVTCFDLCVVTRGHTVVLAFLQVLQKGRKTNAFARRILAIIRITSRLLNHNYGDKEVIFVDGNCSALQEESCVTLEEELPPIIIKTLQYVVKIWPLTCGLLEDDTDTLKADELTSTDKEYSSNVLLSYTGCESC